MLPARLLGVVIFAALSSAPVTAQFLGKDTATWARDLDSKEEKVRRGAAFALGKLGARAVSAVPSLQQATLSDESAKVREAAAFALGEISLRSPQIAKEVAPVLGKALADKEALVRRSAVYALGCTQNEDARRAVETALSDKAPQVRQAAAWALGRLGDGGVASLSKTLRDPDPLVQRDAANALAQLDPDAAREALPALAGLLGAGDPELKKAALGAMIRSVGPEDAKNQAIYGPLQRALLDGDLEIKRNAALTLTNLGGATAVPAIETLVDALRRGDLDLKRQAAAGLRNIGPLAEKALPDLMAALKNPDAELRRFAALAIGGLRKKGEPAVPALVAVVVNHKEYPENRAEAAGSLFFIGRVKEATAAMHEILKVVGDSADDGSVREGALHALYVHNVSLRDDPLVKKTLTRVLVEARTPDNRMVRYNSAYLAGMVYAEEAPDEALPVLLEYLKDNKVEILKNKGISVGGTGQETTGGKASAREIGYGDGRMLAMHAIDSIGARARAYPGILEQVRLLADDARTNQQLRKACKDYLANKSLN